MISCKNKDMIVNFSFSTTVRVRYSETDQMGYCYYGNYAQFFEVGRVETMRSLGISYKSLEEDGIMLPVKEFSVNYHSPAYYDDLLTIKTSINEIKGVKIYFSYEVFNAQNHLICDASTLLVFINKHTMKPIQAPSTFLKLFESPKHVK